MATWKEILAANPAHSENYAARWRAIAASGKDIDGEARLIDAMMPRGAKIIDVGCGTGRVGGYLARRGFDVLGVDVDRTLLHYASEDFPEARWEQVDVTEEPIPAAGFDCAVSAGNVMTFLAPEGREYALQSIHDCLAPGGRFVVGFGAGRGWPFDNFLALAEQAGLRVQNLFESWDLHPYRPTLSQFLVADLIRS